MTMNWSPNGMFALELLLPNGGRQVAFDRRGDRGQQGPVVLTLVDPVAEAEVQGVEGRVGAAVEAMMLEKPRA